VLSKDIVLCFVLSFFTYYKFFFYKRFVLLSFTWPEAIRACDNAFGDLVLCRPGKGGGCLNSPLQNPA